MVLSMVLSKEGLRRALALPLPYIANLCRGEKHVRRCFRRQEEAY